MNELLYKFIEQLKDKAGFAKLSCKETHTNKEIHWVDR